MNIEAFKRHPHDAAFINKLAAIINSAISGDRDQETLIQDAKEFFRGVQLKTAWSSNTIQNQLDHNGAFQTALRMLLMYSTNYRGEPLFVKDLKTAYNDVIVGDRKVTVEVTIDGNSYTSKVVNVSNVTNGKNTGVATHRNGFVPIVGVVKFDPFVAASNGYRTASYSVRSRKHVISGSGFDTVMFRVGGEHSAIGVRFDHRIAIAYSHPVLTELLAAYNKGIAVGWGRDVRPLIKFLETNNIPFVTVRY